MKKPIKLKNSFHGPIPNESVVVAGDVLLAEIVVKLGSFKIDGLIGFKTPLIGVLVVCAS